MISVSRVTQDSRDPSTGDAVASATSAAAADLDRVTAAAAAADGRSPLNEATLLSLRHHGLGTGALWLASSGDEVVGYALASHAPPALEEARDAGEGSSSWGSSGRARRRGRGVLDGPVEVNLVVAPHARGQGAARALAEEVLAAFGPAEISAWSHGNHPAASRLASSLGLERVRDLWIMRRPLSDDHPLPEIPSGPGRTVVRTFRPGQDEDAWLAINVEAFADHPEQGAMTRADLEERMAEPWFDPEGFFLVVPADAPREPELDEAVESPPLLGFHWTKVHDGSVGEIYVLGVSPYAQGRGLGKLLALTGLHHLRDRGVEEVMLYVEADNAVAVAMYEHLGFTHADEDTDVRYLRPKLSAARA